ncbi:MAG: DUF937 domain-containing protein [Planctomycetaceae bacterium]
MAIDLIDQLQQQLEGPVTRQLASRWGESEQATQAGIATLTPATFAALLSQMSAPGGAERLDNALTDGGYDGSLLDDPATTFSGDGTEALIQEGDSVASKLWSDGGASLISAVANQTGMKPTSVRSLLSLLTPLAMSLLGRQKSLNGLDASGLSSLLTSQRDRIQAKLPAGLSAVGSMPAAASAAMAGHREPVAPVTTARTPVLYFLIPLALLAAVGYGCYWYIFDGIRPTGAAGNVIIEAEDIPMVDYGNDAPPPLRSGRGGSTPVPAPAAEATAPESTTTPDTAEATETDDAAESAAEPSGAAPE